ncbi:hypothetical protein [Geobacillus sp. T6]|uniref:hypothetical protein n=1 Tax=Geobacillus sp. T6 TaxID=1659191 RepID=UPI000A593EF6|nr:hypothetical protein [Geobacillus sp. T6]
MFTPFPRMPAGPYPPIDPALFSQSAATAQTLMNDAAAVLKKLAESPSFAASVMSAAQEGKTGGSEAPHPLARHPLENRGVF